MAITVNTLTVSNDLSKINLSLEVNSGQTANKLLLWDQDTYKDPSKQVDLTAKFSQAGNVENIEITGRTFSD